MIRKFVSEAHRVLKPGGGTLVINTISPEQYTTPWYFAILPQTHQGLSQKYGDREREREREREKTRERERERERERGKEGGIERWRDGGS